MLTEHITIDEAEQLTHDHEKALELQKRLNRIIDERGYAVFSDFKYCCMEL